MLVGQRIPARRDKPSAGGPSLVSEAFPLPSNPVLILQGELLVGVNEVRWSPRRMLAVVGLISLGLWGMIGGAVVVLAATVV